MLGASARAGLITGVPLTIDPFIPTIVSRRGARTALAIGRRVGAESVRHRPQRPGRLAACRAQLHLHRTDGRDIQRAQHGPSRPVRRAPVDRARPDVARELLVEATQFLMPGRRLGRAGRNRALTGNWLLRGSVVFSRQQSFMATQGQRPSLRHPSGSLPHRCPARGWRYGRGVPRARHAARAERRDQTPAASLRERCRSPVPLRAGSEDARRAQSPQHRHDSRNQDTAAGRALVLELVEGDTLDQRLRTGSLPVAEAANMPARSLPRSKRPMTRASPTAISNRGTSRLRRRASPSCSTSDWPSPQAPWPALPNRIRRRWTPPATNNRGTVGHEPRAGPRPAGRQTHGHLGVRVRVDKCSADAGRSLADGHRHARGHRRTRTRVGPTAGWHPCVDAQAAPAVSREESEAAPPRHR